MLDNKMLVVNLASKLLKSSNNYLDNVEFEIKDLRLIYKSD